MTDKIKILATVGPSSLKAETIQAMDQSGVDLFRVNLSHTSAADYPDVMKKIQSWTSTPVSTDTEGAQLRTGRMESGTVALKADSLVELSYDEVLGTARTVPLYPRLDEQILRVGDILHVDFNSVAVQLIRVDGLRMTGHVITGGMVGSNKGIGVDRMVKLPFLTAKDREILTLARELGMKHFALSFASSGEHVREFRALFPYPIHLISKIESRIGIQNLSEICEESHEILIDRGDLSKEIAITRIAIAQKYIIKQAVSTGTPVNIATNLLDTMMAADLPSRAEINDITSSLFDGASGLVLAAETAIGKNPVKSVRLVRNVINEVQNRRENFAQQFLRGEVIEQNLVPPHGGRLVQQFATVSQTEIDELPHLAVDHDTLLDAVQIAEGTYSPVSGFMGLQELQLVLEENKLLSGDVWTMPILMQVPAQEAERLNGATELLLTSEEDCEVHAKMLVHEVAQLPNMKDVAQAWFMTSDQDHPGVSLFMNRGNHIVSGVVYLVKKPAFGNKSYELTPRQTRELFHKNLWEKVVGFHTRNIVHRGHEHIQRKAAETIHADCILISPVVGRKKRGDFTSDAIIVAYQAMLRHELYHPFPVILATFNTYARYSGPREAVFTALCRKNFGCSHFIIGRDHTGVGDYYKGFNLQDYCEQLGDLGIELMFFDTAMYCEATDSVVTNVSIPDAGRGFRSISGTQIREMLSQGKTPPEYLLRSEVTESLLELEAAGRGRLFEE